MATTTLPESNVERIRWAFGVLNTHDVSELKQFWTGHHTGAPFQGIAATGRVIDLEGVDHFEFTDEGTIARNSIFFDQMRFARQIAFLPEDGTAADKAAKAAFNAKTRLVAKVRARRG